MNIHEHQAKALLKKFGVPVPRNVAVTEESQIAAAAAGLGDIVVVKSQIHAGGRGKGRFQDAAASP